MVVLFGALMSISGFVLKPISENIKKQKQFVTNAGHELKTPLAIITADIDVLELEVGEDNEWIQSIRNQTERLNQLIKSLLSLSRYDMENKDEPEITVFNVSELINEEINNFKPMAVNKTISFEKLTDGDILVKTEIDNIRQLLGLFLDNAIKYTPENKNIKISIRKAGRKLIMIFENNYDNSKKLNTKRIFERFYRGEKSHNKEIQGYGIGLSIVQSIVEKYNGHVKAVVDDDRIQFIVTLKNNKKKHFEIQ
jgi:signal transduction histidine kinase